ncbi:MAG: SsrA-binding protein SmpB [Chloroflexota bacterium]|nr:SsrA-binding protein SmpB [Chloroflexota bacterium]
MDQFKTIAQNRKAYHNYHIEESIEAGIVLTGTEIKSIREGRVSLGEAYARPDKGELWLLGAHIAPYSCGSMSNHDAKRPRKLLLHRKQIDSLIGKNQEKGLTLVPTKLYLKKGLAKVELGIARGKKVYDKRHSIAQREADREIGRVMKRRTR